MRESYATSKSLGLSRPPCGRSGFARQLIYTSSPTEAVTIPTPERPRKPQRRLGYALPQVHVESLGDGQALVAGAVLPERAGRREIVGAVSEGGNVKLRIHCHGCGEESLLLIGSWQGSARDSIKACRLCSLKKMKGTAAVPQVRP